MSASRRRMGLRSGTRRTAFRCPRRAPRPRRARSGSAPSGARCRARDRSSSRRWARGCSARRGCARAARRGAVSTENATISVRCTMISVTSISAASEVAPMMARGEPSPRGPRARRGPGAAPPRANARDLAAVPGSTEVMRRTTGSMMTIEEAWTGRSMRRGRDRGAARPRRETTRSGMARRHGLGEDLAQDQHERRHDQGRDRDAELGPQQLDREGRGRRCSEDVHDVVAEQNRHEQSRRGGKKVPHRDTRPAPGPTPPPSRSRGSARGRAPSRSPRRTRRRVDRHTTMKR